MEQDSINLGGKDNQRTTRFAEFLANLLQLEVNSAITEKIAEEYFNPNPALLATNDHESTEMHCALSNLTQALGGPPSLLIIDNENPQPIVCDTYPDSVLSELLASFWKARRAICRAHLTFIAEQLATEHPEYMNMSIDDVKVYVLPMTRRYWEQVEYAYIRLAAYWDRAGQLLDYVFFHIRQYENDGFSSVMERIRTNMVSLYPHLEYSECYTNLRSFQKSEGEDGLGWLLRRRNLLIHRVGFSVSNDVGNDKEDNDGVTYISTFNHMKTTQQEKLLQGNQKVELNRLHTQLSRIAALFPHLIAMAQLGADLIPRTKTS